MKSNIAVIEADSVIISMQRASLALVEAKTIQQTKKIMDVAAAAEIYARRQKLGEEAGDLAASIKVEALRKLGEMLKAAPKNDGARGVGKSGVPVEHPTLDELGLTKKESAVAQKLATLSEPEFQQVRDGHITVSKAIAAVQSAKPPKPADPAPTKKPPKPNAELPAEQIEEYKRVAAAAKSVMDEALAENTKMGEILEADDKTKALFEENTQLRAQVKQLRVSMNGHINENNVLKATVRSLQAKLKRMEATQ